MKSSQLTLIALTVCLGGLCVKQKGATNLTIMTFNTWITGNNVENGMEKIVKHIKLISPDVIALQVSYFYNNYLQPKFTYIYTYLYLSHIIEIHSC